MALVRTPYLIKPTVHFIASQNAYLLYPIYQKMPLVKINAGPLRTILGAEQNEKTVLNYLTGQAHLQN